MIPFNNHEINRGGKMDLTEVKQELDKIKQRITEFRGSL